MIKNNNYKENIENMKKILIFIAILTLTLSMSGVAIAQQVLRNPATVLPSGQAVIVPDATIDNSPALERVIFIHYKKGFNRPAEAGAKSAATTCYGFLSRGAMWKTLPISYVVHPDLEAVVPGAIFASAETWDNATSKELFSDTYQLDSTASWDSNTPDGRNELVFGNYPQSGVIAVTVVWGYFSGPPQTRKIVEFDILFDTDYVWGDATQNPSVMDLQNIATHEIGHGTGLADQYNTACGEVTMYGYSDNGETKKRTLEPPDILGLRTLYGI